MTPHPATIVLRLAALIFLVASCYPARILAADAPAAPPVVTVSQPIQRELVERDEFTGQFAAKEYVEIRARVSGYLTEIHFEDGQIVKEGDLLFVIDPRPYEATLAAARAQSSHRLFVAALLTLLYLLDVGGFRIKSPVHG
jgi:multidrug efflux pump subunit AcrA (membrane-fusion protein)